MIQTNTKCRTSFYNGINIKAWKIVDYRGPIRKKTVVEEKVAIVEITQHTQEWHHPNHRLTKLEELSIVLAKLEEIGGQIKLMNYELQAIKGECDNYRGSSSNLEFPF